MPAKKTKEVKVTKSPVSKAKPAGTVAPKPNVSKVPGAKAKQPKPAEPPIVAAESATEVVASKKNPKSQSVKAKGGDTGSVDFQIQNFTDKISTLAKHLKDHPHDFDSRRGLLIMVGKRRRLLNYVKKSDSESYERLTKKLKLKS